MKATGEVMAIDRTFESALMKAIRGLEVKQKDLRHAGMALLTSEQLEEACRVATDERLWALAEALRRGWDVDVIHKSSRVDRWFLRKIERIVAVERAVVEIKLNWRDGFELPEIIGRAMDLGFSASSLRDLLGISRTGNDADSLRSSGWSVRDSDEEGAVVDLVEQILVLIREKSQSSVVKMVDTCAGEFESATPYYYRTNELEDDYLIV
jgi:carbamoyl-phosphate synthase large subunit